MATLQTDPANANVIFVSDGEPHYDYDLSTYGAEAERLLYVGCKLAGLRGGYRGHTGYTADN